MNRTGTLPKKDTMRLLDSLRKQGCNVRRMTRGYRVEFPNGGSTMIHLTNSDSRGTLNTRAAIKRAGLEYPGDNTKKNGGKEMSKVLTPIQDAALRRVLDRVKTHGMYAPVATMAAEARVSLHTFRRRLLALGWTHEGRGPSMVWYAPGAAPTKPEPEKTEYPEIDRAKKLTATRLSDVPAEPRPPLEVGQTKTLYDGTVLIWNGNRWVPTPQTKAVYDGTVLNKLLADASGSRPMTERDREALEDLRERIATIRAAKPKATAATPEVVPEREFIDDRDSWTIAVPPKLQRMAEEMGLNIEVRVWR